MLRYTKNDGLRGITPAAISTVNRLLLQLRNGTPLTGDQMVQEPYVNIIYILHCKNHLPPEIYVNCPSLMHSCQFSTMDRFVDCVLWDAPGITQTERDHVAHHITTWAQQHGGNADAQNILAEGAGDAMKSLGAGAKQYLKSVGKAQEITAQAGQELMIGASEHISDLNTGTFLDSAMTEPNTVQGWMFS